MLSTRVVPAHSVLERGSGATGTLSGQLTAVEIIDRIAFPDPRDKVGTCGNLSRSDISALAGYDVLAERQDGHARYGKIVDFEIGSKRLASVAIGKNSVYQVKVDFGDGNNEWVDTKRIISLEKRVTLKRQ